MVFSKGRSHTHTIGKREQTWHYLPIILCDIIMRARGTEAKLSSWGVNSPNTNQERERKIIIRIRCSLFVLCSMFSDKQENGIQIRTATAGNTHLQWERREEEELKLVGSLKGNYARRKKGVHGNGNSVGSCSSLLSTKINISLQWYKIIPMQQRLNELRKSLELNWDWSLKILTEF